MPTDQTQMFDQNFRNYKFLGIWSGRTPSKYYNYYSYVYLFATFIVYITLLTLNLAYTPRKVELFIYEVIFYFTEITVTSKVLTILLKRDKLIEVLNLIDCDEFGDDYENENGLLYKTKINFKRVRNFYIFIGNMAFLFNSIVPIFVNVIEGAKTELPICKYYFLSDEFRDNHFYLLFVYQSFGIYVHMMYNIDIDSLFAGVLVIAIVQLKILNTKLSTFKLSEEERKLPLQIQDKIQIKKFNKLLRHYEVILKYCETVQDMLSPTLFCQFVVGSIIICVVMSGLLLPATTEKKVFMVIFFLTMTMQLFVPGFLGSQLSYESKELVSAAYNSEWIPRSESFKRSLRLFTERAQSPIIISGLKMFPLSLVTFIAIMKTAYSFFTLVRNAQEV